MFRLLVSTWFTSGGRLGGNDGSAAESRESLIVGQSYLLDAQCTWMFSQPHAPVQHRGELLVGVLTPLGSRLLQDLVMDFGALVVLSMFALPELGVAV